METTALMTSLSNTLVSLKEALESLIQLSDNCISEIKPESKLKIEVKPHVLKEAIAVCKKAISKRPTHAQDQSTTLTATQVVKVQFTT